MDHFDPYNVFLAIAINIPVLLMTGSPSSCPSTFPEVLLAHASLDDWPIVTKHANTDELERQYKCDARDNYVRIFYFTCWNHYVYSLQDLRGTNRTAASTLSLRHLTGPVPRRGGAGRVRLRTLLRACHYMVCGLFGVRPTVPSWWAPLFWWRERRLAPPPNPTVAPFPEDGFHPPC